MTCSDPYSRFTGLPTQFDYVTFLAYSGELLPKVRVTCRKNHCWLTSNVRFYRTVRRRRKRKTKIGHENQRFRRERGRGIVSCETIFRTSVTDTVTSGVRTLTTVEKETNLCCNGKGKFTIKNGLNFVYSRVLSIFLEPDLLQDISAFPNCALRRRRIRIPGLKINLNTTAAVTAMVIRQLRLYR